MFWQAIDEGSIKELQMDEKDSEKLGTESQIPESEIQRDGRMTHESCSAIVSAPQKN